MIPPSAARLAFVPLVALLLADSRTSTGGPSLADRSGRADLPEQVETALGWMPAETETLVVARGPFPLVKPGGRDIFSTDPVDALRNFALGPFVGGRDQHEPFRDALRGLVVEHAAQGTWNFVPPRDVGGASFEACSVVFLRNDPSEAFGRLAEHAKADETIAGYRVLILKEREEREGPGVLGIARVRPRVLVACATTRATLTAILRRVDDDGLRVALPGDLPEWRHVDPSADVWALRHFRPGGSLINISESSRTDTEVVGLTWMVDPGAESLRFRYLSGKEDALDFIRQFWTLDDEDIHPEEVATLEPGVFAVRIPVPRPEPIDPDEHRATPAEQRRMYLGLMLAWSLGFTFII